MKAIKPISCVWLAVTLCLLLCPTAKTEEPWKEHADGSPGLSSTIYDLSALYGTWSCDYKSEGGYVPDAVLDIEISPATKKMTNNLQMGDLVAIDHNLNDIWQELADIVDIHFDAGEYPLKPVIRDSEKDFEIEIPVIGFLNEDNAVICISSEGLSYRDPDVKEVVLNRVEEPTEAKDTKRRKEDKF